MPIVVTMSRNEDQRGPRVWLAVVLVAGLMGVMTSPGAAVPVAAQGPDDVELPALMLVVDASGSMDEPSGDGGSRMAAAETALKEVVAAVPDGTRVGLRVIGGERKGDGSCEDVRLAVPPEPVDRPALRRAVSELDPRGDTPLADALERAAGDLPRDMPGVIVVVTDGMETCGGDPCAVTGELIESGVETRIDVVGFQVEPEARTQLACVADAGDGRYVDAPDAASLVAHMQRLAVRGLRTFTPSGVPVTGTPTAQDAPPIGDGRYVDDLRVNEPKHYRVAVPDGATLWVAASIRPHMTHFLDDMSMEVEVLDAAGSRCEREREPAVGAWSASLPLTAMAVVSGAERDECGPGPYTARVQYDADTREPAEMRAVELLVGLEPPVTTTDGLPPATTEDEFDLEPTAGSGAAEAIGAPDYASAPLLGPGRYSDTILVGETLFYAVELSWGQQLGCAPTLGPSATVREYYSGTPPVLWTRLYGPYRGQASLSFRGETYEGDSEIGGRAVSPPVRYLHREEQDRRAVAIPGTYYCAVTLEGQGGNVGVGPVPLDVVLDVAGEPGTGTPEYAALPDTTPNRTGAPEQTASAGQRDIAGSEGLPGWVPVAGGAALVVVLLAGAATLAAWWVHHRRTGGHGW